MWPFDRRRPPVAGRVRAYSLYLQGRRRAIGILGDVEASHFLGERWPLGHRIAFVLGALSSEDDALIGETELLAEVARRLAPAETPPGPPAVPVTVVDAEKTQRVRPAPAPAPWIGDPLPASATR
jgi:hypothetical protein